MRRRVTSPCRTHAAHANTNKSIINVSETQARRAYGTICSGGRLEALIQARERLYRRCQPVYRCEARSAAGRWTATRAPPAPRSSLPPWTVSGRLPCAPPRGRLFMNTTRVTLPYLQTKCYDSCLFHWSVNPISEYLLDRFIIG